MTGRKQTIKSSIALIILLILPASLLSVQETSLQRDVLPIVDTPSGTETITSAPQATPIAGNASPLPDERLLWNMLHNDKLQSLLRAIESWKHEYPGWQPPAGIVSALNHRGEQGAISNTMKAPAFHAQPESGLCQNLIEITTVLPSSEHARLTQLQKIMSTCLTATDRAALLEISQLLLQPASFEQLLNSVTNTEGHALNTIKYNQQKFWLEKFINANNHRAINKLLNHMGNAIEQHGDVALAEIVAWYHFSQKKYSASSKWFSLCQDWQPSNIEIVYGLALSLYKEGKINEAQPLAEQYRLQSPKMNALAFEITMHRGWQQYQQENYHDSLSTAIHAHSFLASPPSSEMLMAWSYFQLGEYANSRSLAEPHRQQLPQALQLLELIELRKKPTQGARLAGEGVGKIVAMHDEQRDSRKQFLTAYEAEISIDSLQAIDSPSLEAGLMWRHKSGETGTSKLDIYSLPIVSGLYTHNRKHRFSFTVLHTSLHSGAINLAGEPVGSNGFNSSTPSATLVNELNNGTAYRFDYQQSSKISPAFSLGLTPSAGAVDTKLTYELSLTQQISKGYWRTGLYARPVRDSILSYTGMHDPYSNVSWGRVLKQGVELESLYMLGNSWSSFISLSAADLSGEGVVNNRSLSLSVSLGRDMKRKGFHYFTIGPELAYQKFNRNLSHFTLGHGGYFSPESLIRLGLAINYLSKEALRYTFKGRFSLGYQKQSEAAELLFPNATGFDPALTVGGTALSYVKSSDSGLASDFELIGAYLVAPHWQLSGGATMRSSSSYSDFSLGISLRYLFNERQASYSHDIPGWMFDVAY